MSWYMSNWGYNPTCKGYNPIHNWWIRGPPCRSFFRFLGWNTSLSTINPPKPDPWIWYLGGQEACQQAVKEARSLEVWRPVSTFIGIKGNSKTNRTCLLESDMLSCLAKKALDYLFFYGLKLGIIHRNWFLATFKRSQGNIPWIFVKKLRGRCWNTCLSR